MKDGDEETLFERLHGSPTEEGALSAAAIVGAAARSRGRGLVVVSARLLGVPVRWDGGDQLDAAVVERTAEADRDGRLLPLCPEILAGFGCPRPPLHFADGHGGLPDPRLVDPAGRDVTARLQQGVERALARLDGCGVPVERAILKERSPSCGARAIHGRSGLAPGLGLFAAALVRRGIAVEDEQALPARRLPVLKG